MSQSISFKEYLELLELTGAKRLALSDITKIQKLRPIANVIDQHLARTKQVQP